jgi:hypothetical protein
MTEKAKIGQLVQVDLAGLETPGVAFGGGVLGIGKIVEIDDVRQKVKVELDNLSFGDKHENVVFAPADQVQILPDSAKQLLSVVPQH